MDAEKYNRTVELRCPTCACTKFASDGTQDAVMTCARCGRTMTSDEIMRANEARVSQTFDEMADNLAHDALNQMMRGFEGSQQIKIKL